MMQYWYSLKQLSFQRFQEVEIPKNFRNFPETFQNLASKNTKQISIWYIRQGNVFVHDHVLLTKYIICIKITDIETLTIKKILFHLIFKFTTHAT